MTSASRRPRSSQPGPSARRPRGAGVGAAVDRLAALVDDLCEPRRAQARGPRLQYGRASLGGRVSGAVAGTAPLAAAKGVRLGGRVIGPPAELMASTPEVLRAVRSL